MYSFMHAHILRTHGLIYRKRQKFWGWKVSRFAGFIRYAGKVSRFFQSPPSCFPTLKNSYEHLNESFVFLTWILFKTVISILGNGRVYITGTCACRFHAFQDDHAVVGGEQPTVEVSLRWNRSLTSSLLASSASFFLISWQKPSRFFVTAVECFLEFLKISTFQV